MLTLALYGLLAVGLIGGLFLIAVRLLPAGEQIAPPVRDEPLWMLPPDRQLRASDVAEVRLPVALRGYRFAETDQLLDRLVEELRMRDEELARLRGGSAVAQCEADRVPARGVDLVKVGRPPAEKRPAASGPDRTDVEPASDEVPVEAVSDEVPVGAAPDEMPVEVVSDEVPAEAVSDEHDG